MSETFVFHVPDMSCAHCVDAVESSLAEVAGVTSASADLVTKAVTVAGSDLDEGALRAAIGDAGYEAR